MCSEVLKLSKALDDSVTLVGSENSDTDKNGPSNSNTHLYMSAKCLRGQIKEKAQQQRESTKTSGIADDETEAQYGVTPSTDISHEGALNSIPPDLYNY